MIMMMQVDPGPDGGLQRTAPQAQDPGPDDQTAPDPSRCESCLGKLSDTFPEVSHGKLSPGILLKFIKKKLAYNSEHFLWDTHQAILGLVAYFG